ncbi:MAG TPA: hypothetical protein VK021_12495 [Flavobacteriaceae bacterium]|nr:hypothetical protein [Flavobacteriaceae bacterium]
MQRFLLLLIALSLLGCEKFETKKLSSTDIVEEEIKHIDWKNLDSYPSLETCEDITIESNKKQCFENELSKHIFEVLAEHEVSLKDSIREELELKIYISNRGETSLKKVEISAELAEQIPELEDWLNEAVSSLPKIYPAEKRGVPVSSNFKLPLVIQSE